MTLHSSDFTLYALFCLSRLNLPVDPGALARLTGRTLAQTAADVRQLERLGRVAPSRAGSVRLTMLGLARAARLDPMVAAADRGGSAPEAAEKAEPTAAGFGLGKEKSSLRRPRKIKPPIAAKTAPELALTPVPTALSA